MHILFCRSLLCDKLKILYIYMFNIISFRGEAIHRVGKVLLPKYQRLIYALSECLS